jgi:U3 small nucleolar ribonucleoprotein protein IMP3
MQGDSCTSCQMGTLSVFDKVAPVAKLLPFHVQVEKLATASFCRRRLSVVMVRLKMAQTLREAVTFIEQVPALLLCSNHPVARHMVAKQHGELLSEPMRTTNMRMYLRHCVLQGHVRIGPETVTDPAFLVTRNMEDFVTWVDTSKIKRKVQKYNEVCHEDRLLQWLCTFAP